jgi:hypothetical protein
MATIWNGMAPSIASLSELFRRQLRSAIIVIILTMAHPFTPAFGQAPDASDDSLRLYAVGIKNLRPLRQPFIGDGIYLGRGLVLTAAHVVSRWSFLINPRVLITGEELPAKIIKKGSFEDTDLALLSIDEARLPLTLRLRRNLSLCQTFPKIGADVVVVYPDHTSRSQIIAPSLIAPAARTRFSTVIRDVHGSGSAVFDAGSKCLLGIMSAAVPAQSSYRYLELNWRAGYFVPAFKISDFIPAEFHF